MNLKNAFYGVLIALVLFLAWEGYRYVQDLKNSVRLHQDLIEQSEPYKQLSAHAAKLENQYKDAVALKQLVEERFAAEKSALEGRIKVLSNATFAIREKARTSGQSDLEYQGDKTKYVVNEIRFNDGPPVGYVLIFDDGRVVSKLYNHNFNVNTAVSRDEDSGRYSVVSKAEYILKSPSLATGKPSWLNKPYPLPITGGMAVIDPTEKNQLAPRLHLWAPHMNGGLTVGAGGQGAFTRISWDMSMAGFGPSINDLDWKFLHLGFDADTKLQEPGIHILPFSYRFWPAVLTNTYVGPGLGWTRSGYNLQINLNLTF